MKISSILNQNISITQIIFGVEELWISKIFIKILRKISRYKGRYVKKVRIYLIYDSHNSFYSLKVTFQKLQTILGNIGLLLGFLSICYPSFLYLVHDSYWIIISFRNNNSRALFNMIINDKIDADISYALNVKMYEYFEYQILQIMIMIGRFQNQGK